MRTLLTSLQMRQAESYTMSQTGVGAMDLMQRAGEALSREVLRVAEERNAEEITVVCGAGNNGGDGYVCAIELLKAGKNVKVYSITDKNTSACVRMRAAYTGEYTQTIGGDIIVDCIFGTGLTRSVEGDIAEVIEEINNSGAFVISADIPSGIDSNSGLIMGVAVRADLTTSFGEYKLGQFLLNGLDNCGEVVRCDIGIVLPPKSFVMACDDDDIKPLYGKRKRHAYKSTFGTANIVAGSEKYMGAAVLATDAALKSGCGFVKLTTERDIKLALVTKYPQVIYTDECDLNAQCIAIGMGCGISEELYATICDLLKNYTGTLIIDADGLNSLAKYGMEVLRDKKCNVILTPHLKEFSRISGISTGVLFSATINMAKEFAHEYGVILVLKNASTVITDGNKVVLNVSGNSSLAKAGSGDMLSGLMCGTVARGVKPFEAAICSCYVFGKTAEICSEEKSEYCVYARDILSKMHVMVKRLSKQPT